MATTPEQPVPAEPEAAAPGEAALASIERGGSTYELVFWPLLIIATYYPIYYLIDVNITQARPPAALWDLYWTAVDGRIPFWPAWQLVYVAIYLGALLPVFVVRDPLLIRRAAYCYGFSMVVSFTCFIAIPVTAEGVRASPSGEEDFFHWLAKLHYHWDAAGNCFPSLHVAIALNAAFIVGYAWRPVGIAALVGAVLIAISTVFVKQHYFVDAVAGLLVGLAGERIFLRGYRRPPPGAPPPARGWPALALYGAVYVVVLAVLYAVYRSGFRPWEGA